MKLPNDKTLKILLSSGQVVHLYADDRALWKMKDDYEFLPMRDEGNEIYVKIRDITAFEILDERKTQENPQAAGTESAPV